MSIFTYICYINIYLYLPTYVINIHTYIPTYTHIILHLIIYWNMSNMCYSYNYKVLLRNYNLLNIEIHN